MLTQTLGRATVILAAAVLITGSWQAAATARSGPGGGGFGGTICGQSYTPGCAVTAGTPGSSGSGDGPGSGTQAGGRSPCTRTGPLTVVCLLVIGGPGRGAAGPPAPVALAQIAVRYLRLPSPVIRSSPAPGALQLTGLPTWLWVAPAAWRPQSQTAQVPGEAVTATATPVSASWQMGDGQTVTCQGPGTPYTAADNPAAPSPTCGYTYTRSSAGQPGAAYHVTLTITWDISWTGTGGAGGVLPPLLTQAATAMRVAESQAVNTGGGA